MLLVVDELVDALSHVLGAAHALLRQEDHLADGGRLRRGAHHQVEQGRQDVQRVGHLRGHVHLRHHRQVRMQPSVRLEARSWLTKLQSLVPSPASITVRTQNCSTRARRRSRCSSSSTTRPRSSIYRSTCRCSSSVASIDCVNHNVVRHHRSLLSAAAGAVARRHHASLSRRNLRFCQSENIDFSGAIEDQIDEPVVQRQIRQNKGFNKKKWFAQQRKNKKKFNKK